MSTAAAGVKRVLLVAEAVTLAHVARPLCFARGLDRGRYRIAIAAARGAAPHVAAEGYEHIDIESVEPKAFLTALARGRALYDAATLRRYVQSDLGVIGRFAPDLVVGDFRLSLSVSARLSRVPYVNIASAYWSPYYTPPRWPVPSLPLTRVLPLAAAQVLFSVARPAAFALHCAPLNQVRRHHGLPALPRDLRQVYTDADRVVYSDLPEIFPTTAMPASHRFIGPALWEPAMPLPAWWNDVPEDRPCIYVTMGSSGEATLLPRIVDALASLPASVLVASAGSELGPQVPRNVFVAPYLPGIRAAQRAQLVICNGGSLTAYQALAGGAAVLGIAGNLDQFLNMTGFEQAGVGRGLRADRCSGDQLRAAAGALLANASTRMVIGGLRERSAMFDFPAGAAQLVAELVG